MERGCVAEPLGGLGVDVASRELGLLGMRVRHASSALASGWLCEGADPGWVAPGASSRHALAVLDGCVWGVPRNFPA